MARVTERVGGRVPKEGTARTLEELRALPFVAWWEKQEQFKRWSVSTNTPPIPLSYLMAEWKDGTSSVAAYLDEPGLYGLPEWEYNRD